MEGIYGRYPRLFIVCFFMASWHSSLHQGLQCPLGLLEDFRIAIFAALIIYCVTRATTVSISFNHDWCDYCIYCKGGLIGSVINVARVCMSSLVKILE